MPARVGSGRERPVGAAHLVDVSRVGMLLAFTWPTDAALAPGDHLVVSVPTDAGSRHVIGVVRRVERGRDGNLYVGVDHERADPDDLELLSRPSGTPPAP